MRDSDVRMVQEEVASYFRETWPIIKAVIGNDDEESWKALINKTDEMLRFSKVDKGVPRFILTEEEVKELTAREQCVYQFGKFLWGMLGTLENLNKQLMLWDGERVPYHSGFREEKRKE